MTTYRCIGLELAATALVTGALLAGAWLPVRLWSDRVPYPQPYTPQKLEVHQARAERLTWPARNERLAHISIWTGADLKPPEGRKVLEDRPGVTVFASGDTVIEQTWLHRTRDGKWHPPIQVRQAQGGKWEMNVGAESAPAWVWWAIEKLNREENRWHQQREGGSND